MSSAPMCWNCGRPMPNYNEALCVGSELCRDCFKVGLGTLELRNSGLILGDISLSSVAPSLFGLIDGAINPALLKSFDGRVGQNLLEIFIGTDRTRNAIAALALTYSIQDADDQGVFSRPASLIREAARIILPKRQETGHYLTVIRRFLMGKNLWVSVGRQLRGKAKNLMRLGESVLEVTR